MSTNTPSLTTVLDLARARTLVLRDIDVPLGGHHGLGLNDLAILLELKAAPAQTLRRVELARRLAVTTSGIARQLAPLERIGLVGRESDLMDARLALVVLTARGAEIAEEARVTAEEAAAHALRNVWSDDELETLAPLLSRASAGPVRPAG
jgi:DNA-binding MarR family transcriptional regulator